MEDPKADLTYKGGLEIPQSDSDPTQRWSKLNPSLKPTVQRVSHYLRGTSKDEEIEHHKRNDLQRTSVVQAFRASQDEKVVGLKNYGLNKSTYALRRRMQSEGDRSALTSGRTRPLVTVEEMEEKARKKAIRNPLRLVYLGNLAALKVMLYYLITWETVLVSLLTVGLTCYWYFRFKGDASWTGSGFDFILLAFAVTSPIAAALAMAFNRRERALIAIADFRSFSYHLYLAHCIWDWPENGGRTAASLNVDWVEHCDAVLAQLVGIGDELARFLSLPTTSRSRHRMTKSGRKEAARTMEAAYNLLESMSTQRMTRLTLYSERLKKIGLPSSEVSRIRQYERFLTDNIEQLRMVKIYRTPQALRSFARIFTLILPPFYSPSYAQLARDVESLGMGIAFGVITAVCLTALFESLEVLEDPFTAFLALDGIDVKEEFEVLHFAQLISTRHLVFPNAPDYPPTRRAALTGRSSPTKLNFIGTPPVQTHHERAASKVPSVVELGELSSADEDWVYDAQLADVELGTVLSEMDDERATAFSEADDATWNNHPRSGNVPSSKRRPWIRNV